MKLQNLMKERAKRLAEETDQAERQWITKEIQEVAEKHADKIITNETLTSEDEQIILIALGEPYTIVRDKEMNHRPSFVRSYAFKRIDGKWTCAVWTPRMEEGS